MEYYRELISDIAIQSRVMELARQISRDYSGKHPLIITLLKGAFIFLADLVRHLTIPHEIDFITLSSYRNGSRRSPKVEILDHLRTNINNRHVLIIDEIIDTGHTMFRLIEALGAHNARSLRICTLLDKPAAREVNVPVHYIGFTIPQVFVVGYGLDYMERFRNLSCIAELKRGVRETCDDRGSAVLAQLVAEEHGEGDVPSLRMETKRGAAAEKPFRDETDS